MEEKLAELRALRAQLTRYANTLNRPFGALDKTIHELLWAEQRTRHLDDELPAKLRQVRIKNAQDITESSVDRALEKLRLLEGLYATLVQDFGSPGKHPWNWVSNHELTPFGVEDLIAALKKWRDSVDTLQTELDRGETLLCNCADANIADVLPVESESVCAEMLAHCASALSRGAAEEFCNDVRDFHERLEMLTDHLEEPRRTVDDGIAILEKAFQQIRILPEEFVPLPISQLNPVAANCLARAARYDRLVKHGTRLLGNFGIDNGTSSLTSLRQIFAAADLLSTAERSCLLLREPATTDEMHTEIIQQAAAVCTRLNEEQLQLERQFVLPEEMDEMTLRKHVTALQDAGFLGALLPRTRRAKQFFRGFQRERAKVRRDAMAGHLTNLAEFARSKNAFLADRRVQEACGRHFLGLRTDFGSLAALTSWAERVRSTLAGQDEITRALRVALLCAPVELLDTVGALARDPEFASARGLLDEHGLDDTPLQQWADNFRKTATVLQTLDTQLASVGCKAGMMLTQLERVLFDLQSSHDLAKRVSENRAAREIVGEGF